jgi:crossover junction endodeoxyribonuclease RuvC
MRIMGLDPGSRRTGYGVVEQRGGRLVALAQGHVQAPAREELPRRLHAICVRIGEIMTEYRPEMVAVEEAFYHESVRSTLVLGHVRGALLVQAVARGLEVFEYSPRTIKLAVTGSGAASKQQVEYMVRRLLGLRGVLSADASDGLAVAICHWNRAGRTDTRKAATAAASGLAALLARRGVRVGGNR